MKDTSQQHGPEGGYHFCVQCTTVYRCATVHSDNRGPMLPGGRCCLPCKTSNLVALDRIEQDQRRRICA